MKVEDNLSKRNRQAIKIERIFRILLSICYAERSVRRISKEADTDYHWTYKTLKELERDGIVQGTKIIDPMSLFKKWADRPTSVLFREYHIQDPKKFIHETDLDYAMTTYYAENQIGSYLIPRIMDIYIHEKDINLWHEKLIDNGYVGKGNVRILLADEHVFWDSIQEGPLKTVSIQQLIVDLMREGGVCTEAAEILVERYYGRK